jgi:hypothetical protein
MINMLKRNCKKLNASFRGLKTSVRLSKGKKSDSLRKIVRLRVKFLHAVRLLDLRGSAALGR